MSPTHSKIRTTTTTQPRKADVKKHVPSATRNAPGNQKAKKVVKPRKVEATRREKSAPRAERDLPRHRPVKVSQKVAHKPNDRQATKKKKPKKLQKTSVPIAHYASSNGANPMPLVENQKQFYEESYAEGGDENNPYMLCRLGSFAGVVNPHGTPLDVRAPAFETKLLLQPPETVGAQSVSEFQIGIHPIWGSAGMVLKQPVPTEVLAEASGGNGLTMLNDTIDPTAPHSVFDRTGTLFGIDQSMNFIAGGTRRDIAVPLLLSAGSSEFILVGSADELGEWFYDVELDQLDGICLDSVQVVLSRALVQGEQWRMRWYCGTTEYAEWPMDEGDRSYDFTLATDPANYPPGKLRINIETNLKLPLSVTSFRFNIGGANLTGDWVVTEDLIAFGPDSDLIDDSLGQFRSDQMTILGNTSWFYGVPTGVQSCEGRCATGVYKQINRAFMSSEDIIQLTPQSYSGRSQDGWFMTPRQLDVAITGHTDIPGRFNHGLESAYLSIVVNGTTPVEIVAQNFMALGGINRSRLRPHVGNVPNDRHLLQSAITIQSMLDTAMCNSFHLSKMVNDLIGASENMGKRMADEAKDAMALAKSIAPYAEGAIEVASVLAALI